MILMFYIFLVGDNCNPIDNSSEGTCKLVVECKAAIRSVSLW